MSARGPQRPSGAAASRSGAGPTLSIGDLADATGVSPGLLRMWENRFGFPVATRLPSGHRRYRPEDVDAVRDVLARQEAGLRLDRAIAATRALLQVDEPSVFAAVRTSFPTLPRQRLRKSTLIALSHAIEEEMCARGRQGHAFGAFQHESFFAPSHDRWSDLARRSELAMVFADFPEGPPAPEEGRQEPVLVPLTVGAPLRDEWAVVCDSPAFSAVLSAWEPPGQRRRPDGEREFETVWTLQPETVRTAAQVCVDVAVASGAVEGVEDLRDRLAGSPISSAPTPLAVTEFCDRVIRHLDDRERARGRVRSPGTTRERGGRR